ncbi:TIGR03089 family protein [Arthrobacter sp. JZ12]|uniref:TIGR03089 family protein n=1 Tax=Arthrobacter sp. JZ12 TaxID=2654190 RepID=UPI002B45B5D6|nr:TIGR03089 family protein [Arthrobacter sp. JZ12]WRH24387.1 TIGR03089 family protein [Arthrobacter sp. JZ12]
MTSSQSVEELLESFRQASGSPRLIWYGPNHERVELSGRVLENWVAKTSNLLVEELDGTADTVVHLDMPPHWKSLVWALACWQVGALTRVPDDVDTATSGSGAEPAAGIGAETRSRADIVVSMDAADTASPAQAASALGNPLQVLVAPGALDMRWPGPLPDGAVDYAALVRSYGDVYLDPVADGAAPLMAAGGRNHTFQELAATPLDADPAGTDARKEPPLPGVWLVPAGLPLRTVLSAAVRIWAGGSAVVLVHPDVEITERLVDGERVTARLAP